MPEDLGRFDGPERSDPSSASGLAPESSARRADPGDPRLAAALTQLRVLAGALAASVLVYAGIAWFITSGAGGGGYAPVGLPAAIVALLAALAVFDLVIAPFIERVLDSGGLSGTSPERSRDLEVAIAAYRRGKIIGFAFREAAAILGLLISLFTGNPTWCYALVAATLVAMALAWPSRDGLARAVGGSVQPE